MKILGMAHGQLGDQFIQLPFIDFIKHRYFCNDYTCNINNKYSCAIDVLKLSPLIDDFFISDEYENFPSEKDRKELKKRRYDKIFDPMPKHKNSASWHTERHQTSEIFNMYGFESDKKGYQIFLDEEGLGKLHDLKKTITLAPFAGFYNPNNDKKLTLKKAEEIVEIANDEGYEVIQIGGSDEPLVRGAHQAICSYFHSIKLIVSSRFFIHTDTGSAWIGSGFKHPSIGLYSDSYYTKEYIKNIQPINPNAIYLSEDNVNNITIDSIKQAIREIK